MIGIRTKVFVAVDTDSSMTLSFLSSEEEAALWKGIGRLALNDIPAVKALSGLDNRNLAQLNKKIRGEFRVS